MFSRMGASKKKRAFVSDNKDFVRLIQVLKEEPDIRETLKSILTLDTFHRKSALNTWLEELSLKKAPQQFRSALSCLLDDDIAQKALEIIQE
jgi:hypothetical protein